MDATADPRAVIVALDFSTQKACLECLSKLDPSLCRVKIGKELFTACGPELVRTIIREGFDVFLDLKFHDIPNTVAGAVSAAADLGVWMLNVHASGGRAMLEAARTVLPVGDSPLLIAVTVLTSLGKEDLAEVGIDSDPGQHVLRLASLTADCGLDGVVCSSRESALLRERFGHDFCLVTPGIRPAGADHGDQKRVETPARAIELGSNYLVIGRPVTKANDPNAVLRQILSDIS